MDHIEGKQKFIQTWGTLGSSWGINRTMAQIHALLLLSCKPMNCEQIKNDLKISAGNTNMNIRALLDWGLIHKELIPGERKDFYRAEKDMVKVLKAIIIQRKKKELAPLIATLDDLKDIQGECDCSKELNHRVQDLRKYAGKVETTLDLIVKAEESWLMKSVFKNLG